MAGGNPTLYGYVYDTLCELDPFGLGRMPSWMTTRKGWQRHHLIPVSVWDKYFIPQEAGMNVNGATNMTYLPVAQGIDLVNPNSSLHVGWNNVHSEYNQYISQTLQCCFIPCHKETGKNHLCNGKKQGSRIEMPLNFSVNISFLECRQRHSACHAVFNVQIYLKCISAIHSKNLIFRLDF